jgi:hypothetical protein
VVVVVRNQVHGTGETLDAHHGTRSEDSILTVTESLVIWLFLLA